MLGAAEPDPEIEKAWAAEITRRAERAHRRETAGIPVLWSRPRRGESSKASEARAVRF
jgi:hypothetical protein